jgi:hypothetical protein
VKYGLFLLCVALGLGALALPARASDIQLPYFCGSRQVPQGTACPGVAAATQAQNAGPIAVVLSTDSTLKYTVAGDGPSKIAATCKTRTCLPSDLTGLTTEIGNLARLANELPDFCGSTGTTKVTHGSACRGGAAPTQAQNARSIAVILSADSTLKYAVAAIGDTEIAAACKMTCTGADDTALQDRIDTQAHRYIYPLPAIGLASAAAQRLNSLYSSWLVATALDSNHVQLASDAPLSTPELAQIQSSIQLSPALLSVDLPYYCISTTLDGHEPFLSPPAICRPTDQRVQAANGSDIATAVGTLAKDLNFTVTAPGASRLAVTCSKPPCLQADIDRLAAVIRGMALVTPAYIQYFDVSAGSAATAAKDIAALKFKGITVDQLGPSKIRLKSDVPVSRQEVDALISQYLYGNHAPPEFRMFYQDAPSVVTALTPPASANTSPGTGAGGNAAAGNSPGGTTANPANPSANSPGTSANPSAASGSSNSAAITYSVKTETTGSGTPAPSQSQTAGAGGATGSTGSTAAKDTSSPSTTTSTTTTITPPAAPSTPAPAPAPTLIGKNMQAFSDNVVFADTSNDQTVWQQVRLLTLLDLPRPEVLMNVWSYQTSSPDGRDIEGRAELVRDLVSGQNQTLENSIQYGWTFLSKQMHLDKLHQDITLDLRQPAATDASPLPNQPQDLAATDGFFDHDFYDYITQKFVSDPPGSLNSGDRNKWGFCPVGKFCLGFTHAFQPLKPNLTSILLGAIASNRPLATILKTIGCMEGKYEVYRDCFPERDKLLQAVHLADEDVTQKLKSKSKDDVTQKRKSKSKSKSNDVPDWQAPTCPDCTKQMEAVKLAASKLTDACTACQSDLAGLKQDLEVVETKCPACQTQLESVKSELRTLDTKYSARAAQIHELDAAYTVLTRRDFSIKHIVAQVKALPGDCLDCQEPLQTKPTQTQHPPQTQAQPPDLGRLRAEQSAWLTEVGHVSVEVRERIDRYGEGLAQLGTLEVVLSLIDCPDCTSKAKATVVTLKTAYTDQRTALVDLESVLNALEATCPDCQSGISQLSIVVKRLDSICTDCPTQVTGLGAELDRIKADYPAPVAQLTTLESTLDALKPECPTCQTPKSTPELKPLTLQCPDWNKELADLQNALTKAEHCKDCLKLAQSLEPLKKQCPGCQQELEDLLRQYAATLREQISVRLKLQALLAECPSCLAYQTELEKTRTCLRTERHRLLHDDPLYRDRLSCQVLDEVALKADESCHIAQTFPLSCFTIQATQSFSLTNIYSTFTLEQLNELAEEPLATLPIVARADSSQNYGTTRVGLLRAAVADFLFNYKMSQEFPQEFTPYNLQHSAQELNAELNPLVIAFNEDVAAFSHHLSSHLEPPASGQQLLFSHLWPNHKSFLSDGLITVRGIGGIQSTVNTATQNYFDATQATSLSSILNALTGQGGSAGGGGSTASTAAGILSGSVNPATALAALAAITPPPTQAKIGRQLNFIVKPHTLPGASSAELEVQLLADESADPSLYQSGKATGASDTLSRVAQHDITTRVRVESVKLFELSSFSALLQRPRSKFPLIPPFIELPLIGSIASIQLPGLKEYHRSTAIVSAIIVPTATDLAYGMDFVHDRIITKADTTAWDHLYEMRPSISFSQFTRTPIHAFHGAMVNCFATNGSLINPGGMRIQSPAGCGVIDFRNVPPEF